MRKKVAIKALGKWPVTPGIYTVQDIRFEVDQEYAQVIAVEGQGSFLILEYIGSKTGVGNWNITSVSDR